MQGEKYFHAMLSEQQYRLLCLVAEAERCRRTDIVQRALAEYLREHAPKALAKIGADLRVK